MPIRIPDALPATSILEGENIFVMTEHRAMHQDIRPLRVLLLNLMPTKIVTETQIMRKLSTLRCKLRSTCFALRAISQKMSQPITLRRFIVRLTRCATFATTA